MLCYTIQVPTAKIASVSSMLSASAIFAWGICFVYFFFWKCTVQINLFLFLVITLPFSPSLWTLQGGSDQSIDAQSGEQAFGAFFYVIFLD